MFFFLGECYAPKPAGFLGGFSIAFLLVKFFSGELPPRFIVRGSSPAEAPSVPTDDAGFCVRSLQRCCTPGRAGMLPGGACGVTPTSSGLPRHVPPGHATKQPTGLLIRGIDSLPGQGASSSVAAWE